MKAKAPRIASAWLVALLATAVLAALYAVGPRAGIRERVASVGEPSALSVAYLEAWSRVEPDNEEYLSLLAAQYADLGMTDDLERIERRMEALGTPDMRRAAMTARVAVAEQRAFALAESDPRRADAVAQVRAQIAAAAALEWSARDLRWLAEQAAASGAPGLAMDLYTRLSQGDPAGRSQWDTQIARYALEVGDYRAAAAAWFRREDAARTLDERRRCFLAGIRTLRSGNMIDEALAAADAHAGMLLDDAATLVALVDLARAANRPDAVDRYARLLARYAEAKTQRDQYAVVRRAASPRDVYAYMDGPTPACHRSLAHIVSAVFKPSAHAAPTAAPNAAPNAAANAAPHRALSRPLAGAAGLFRVVRVAAQAGSAASGAAAASGAPERAGDSTIADTVYRAFLEAGDTANAERIARQQVARDGRSIVWRQRLAQASQWNGDASIALQAWLGYAQLSNDDEAWRKVERMASMLDDDEAYLAAAIHAARAAPGDLRKVDSVTAAYERLGRPEDALAFLRSLPRRPGDIDAIDTRIGELAERAGHDDEALAAYRQVQGRRPRDAAAALRTASVLYRNGHPREAFEALALARAGAGDADSVYWRNYGELARLLGRDEDAAQAYRHLLAGDGATPEDLGEMTYFYDPYPIDAGRVAELRFRRDHSMTALQDAIHYYTAAKAMDRVALLLDSLSADERAAALAAPGVLEARAEYYRLAGRPDEALDDLRIAARLPGANGSIRAAYLWMLVDYGKDAELAATMRRWEQERATSAALWQPFAAAALRLNRPAVALDYLRRAHASMSRDPLWLLTYADALELAGDPDRAWSIRRKAWLALRKDATHEGRQAVASRAAGRAVQRNAAVADAEALDERRARRVALATDFTTGDDTVALLADLLSGGTAAREMSDARRSLLGAAAALPGAAPQSGADAAPNLRLRDAVAKEVAIAWAASREANPLAKRWLAQQYAARLARPADAQLTIALAENDVPQMERLLEEARSRLPIYDRIDATVAIDRPQRAEQLAYDALAGAPGNTGLHTRLVDTALTWPQSIDATVTTFVEHPLDYTEATVGASRKIAERYLIGVTGVQHFQRSTDANELVNVPSVDRWVSAYLRRQTAATSLSVTAGRREALDSFDTLELAAVAGRDGPLSFGIQAGRNQVADESQTLLVGGMKDRLTGELTWRATERLALSGSVEADRFYSQARHFLGSGMLSTGELSYRIRNEYPDYTVRLVGARGQYSASGTADGLISRLVPAQNLPATAADVMPQSYVQYGLRFGFGTDLLTQYTHRWRPFVDVGVTHDSNQGWGPDVALGLAGSVFGGDHAALYFQHQRVSRQGTPVTEIGMRYSWFY